MIVIKDQYRGLNMKMILKNAGFWCFVLLIFSAHVKAADEKDVCLPFSLKYQWPDARRVWLASTLPADIQQQVVKLQANLRKLGLKGGHFEKPERLHVTLRFLGSINSAPATQDAITKALEKVPIYGPRKGAHLSGRSKDNQSRNS